MRRAVFQALMHEKNSGTKISAKEINSSALYETIAENVNLSQIKYLGEKLKRFEGEIRYRNSEIERLSSEVRRLQANIDRIHSTYSWRLTAPLRNSKILKQVFRKKSG